MPASDSVPPSDDASTVVTEFPQHLIDALAQSAGLPPRAAQVTPTRDERPPIAPAPVAAPGAGAAPQAVPGAGAAPQAVPGAPPAPISPMATVEMPAAALETVELAVLPPSSKNPTVIRPPFTTLLQSSGPGADAPTPAMGSPKFYGEDEARAIDEAEEIDELQLEPYESPISVDVVPPSASPVREAPPPAQPFPGGEQGAQSGAAAQPSPPSFTFSPQRSPGYTPAKPAMAWAEPPPPILMDPPTSAIGWAIGGIVVGLLLLGLVVWLVVLAVRHFI